jgi:cytochrome c
MSHSHLRHARSVPTLVLLSTVVAAAAFGVASPSNARAADEACTTTKFHYPAVEKACKDGGRKAAKELMKAAVKKQKAAGNDVKCTSCHEDTKDFKLKDNAVKDLKPWI